MEIARALSMIMQLGIFGVFIGNIKLVRDTTYGIISYYNLSFEPEWASMLGTARVLLRSAPWIIVFPAIAFFISVLGFNMVGEGLRISFQSKNKSGLKKFKYFIAYISSKLKSKRTAAVALIVLLLLIVVSSSIISYSKAPIFNLHNQNIYCLSKHSLALKKQKIYRK